MKENVQPGKALGSCRNISHSPFSENQEISLIRPDFGTKKFTWSNQEQSGVGKIELNLILAGSEFVGAGRLSLWRPFSMNFPYSDLFLNFLPGKICSRFSDIVSFKIDFIAYGLHRDHPPAWSENGVQL